MIHICNYCGEHIPHRLKINGKYRYLSSRKFCLNCHPFKTNKNIEKIESNEKHKCSQCGNIKSTYDFYIKSSGKLHTFCKTCFKKDIMKRRFLKKLQAIEYLGGKCKKCGYSDCIDALDFHHRDSKEKRTITQ